MIYSIYISDRAVKILPTEYFRPRAYNIAAERAGMEFIFSSIAFSWRNWIPPLLCMKYLLFYM